MLPEKDAKLGEKHTLLVEIGDRVLPYEVWNIILRENLPGHEVPRRIVGVKEIPRNTSFKPDRAHIENNTGLGINPGLGIEFSINDNIGFHLLTGYYLILLSEENFYVPEQHEHLNAIIFQAGLKLSFLKSKDI